MTLDLGFSCFFLDLPEHLQQHFPDKKKLQITLVDCPGHASLIRTIIGGAQIIDMVLLIVDAVSRTIYCLFFMWAEEISLYYPVMTDLSFECR
jgi:hypothetical protein